VAHDQWVPDRDLAREDADVGAADARRGDVDQDLRGLGLDLGSVLYRQSFRRLENNGAQVNQPP
jgi:hypothetical protein